jgi:hypothetical protein
MRFIVDGMLVHKKGTLQMKSVIAGRKKVLAVRAY